MLESILLRHSPSRAYSLFGLNVTGQGSEQEIDLCFYDQGKLILAECKEFKAGIDNKQLAEVKGQVGKLAGLAKRIGADAVVLATFSPNYPDALIKKCISLGNTNGIAVNIVNLVLGEILDLNDSSQTYKFTERPIYWRFR